LSILAIGRTASARVSDVRALVLAARSVAAAQARLVPEVVRTTGLSEEGVRLAFAHHLELYPTEAELLSLVAGASEASRVHVILSAGVFVAALRALAVARASAPVVTVRPSVRDPVFARALVEALDDPSVSLAASREVSSIESGEIHVYGRDETTASVRSRARAGVVVRGHGAGLGVACVSRSADLRRVAGEVARDVVPFDQRGCLSPRVVVVVGDDARAAELGAALHEALLAASAQVPRGLLSTEERALATRYAESLGFAGRVWREPDHIVGFAPQGALLVPPPGRHVHVLAASDVEDVRRKLEPLAPFVVAFGTDDPLLAAAAPARARVSSLGAMQRPPLDGPVDLR